jgi:putative flippase GtrA
MNDFFVGLTNRKSVTQLFRYGLVGIASNVAGYMLYLLITHFGIQPKIAISFLYPIGAFIGFWGNRKLTFAHKGSLLGAGFRYIIAHGLGYFINLAILIVMVDKLGYPHQWVQAIAIFIVAAFLFLAFKFFVFRKPIFSIGEAK